jgi:hypothetical protein
MLWTVLLFLFVLWLMGLITQIGTMLYVLLILALVLFLIDRLAGRRIAL